MHRRTIISAALASMALAGLDLFATIILCGSSEQVIYPRVFLMSATLASILLLHSFFGFFQAWQKRWDGIKVLAAIGFVPATCLAVVAIMAISEALSS